MTKVIDIKSFRIHINFNLAINFSEIQNDIVAQHSTSVYP